MGEGGEEGLKGICRISSSPISRRATKYKKQGLTHDLASF